MTDEGVRIDERVCIYCAHLKIAHDKDGNNYGCGMNVNSKGCYARTEWGPDEVERARALGIDAVDMFSGCDKFEPNGAAVHPQNHARIVQINPLCKEIRTDESLSSDPWKLMQRIEAALPRSAVVSPDKIQ